MSGFNFGVIFVLMIAFLSANTDGNNSSKPEQKENDKEGKKILFKASEPELVEKSDRRRVLFRGPALDKNLPTPELGIDEPITPELSERKRLRLRLEREKQAQRYGGTAFVPDEEQYMRRDPPPPPYHRAPPIPRPPPPPFMRPNFRGPPDPRLRRKQELYGGMEELRRKSYYFQGMQRFDRRGPPPPPPSDRDEREPDRKYYQPPTRAPEDSNMTLTKRYPLKDAIGISRKSGDIFIKILCKIGACESRASAIRDRVIIDLYSHPFTMQEKLSEYFSELLKIPESAITYGKEYYASDHKLIFIKRGYVTPEEIQEKLEENIRNRPIIKVDKNYMRKKFR